MLTEVILVAGLVDHDVGEEIWRSWPGSVLVRYDLRDLVQGVVRRWVDSELTALELAHGCVSCTLGFDLVPLLERLGGRVVVHLDPRLEPEAICFALCETDVRVEAVVTVVDRATWLADATGEDLLAERDRSATEDDDRTVAQIAVGPVEFADCLVLTGARADLVLDAVLDRLNPRAARHDRRGLDAAALLGAIPPDARRGRFDDGFGTLLNGRPSREPSHGVAVVHFAAHRPMRLYDALDVLLDGVVRTRGRLWVVSQPDRALWLESAGGGLTIGSLGSWLAAVDDWSQVPPACHPAGATGQDRRPGEPAQEVVVITVTTSPEEITRALRGALVTDEELALADELEFVDPFAESHDEMDEMEEL
ncbi:cobalamin biosynthesis protein CobW [Parafrankia soli]|uniref:Cobalamin biosynthesis protein CobW n=1 Tax=Parafrankia soli TaxID=2599596 RepID=A0A1S1QC20_9ACTN|nr:GTP-binding protein [Parafrankia soli]OHV31119.1 cobalamin biosynthesis protein CobW [Parafrankia soli]